MQSQLNFSRDMEREADRNGFALMPLAGFAPAGMASMFGKLDAANRINDNGAFPYLRSHPLTVERIGEARQRASLEGERAPAPADTLRWHALMQARARVLMDPSTDALRRLQDLDAARNGSADERAAALYAGAQASLLLRDFDRAERALSAARALPGAGEGNARRTLARQGIELALARGDAASASKALAELADDASRPALLLRAQVALASGEPAALRSSAEALQTWVAERRGDATAWTLLGRCAERQGQSLRAVRAEAEAQAASGNLQGAIDRLRAGQRMVRSGTAGVDFIEASVIDSRLREFMQQHRELMAERRGVRSGRPEATE
jgi:predicted Zn-dependent protease